MMNDQTCILKVESQIYVVNTFAKIVTKSKLFYIIAFEIQKNAEFVL